HRASRSGLPSKTLHAGSPRQQGSGSIGAPIARRTGRRTTWRTPVAFAASMRAITGGTDVASVALSFVVFYRFAGQVGDALHDPVALFCRQRSEGARQPDFLMQLLEGLGTGNQG